MDENSRYFWIIPIAAFILGGTIGAGAIEYKVNTVWPAAAIEAVELKDMSCSEIKDFNSIGKYWVPDNGKYAREKVEVCIEAEKAEILRIKDKCEGLEHNWLPETKTCELTTIYPGCSGLGLDDCKYVDSTLVSGYYELKNDGISYGNNYEISGATVNEIKFDSVSNSILIPLEKSENGYIRIIIPSKIFESTQLLSSFFVLIDGEEVAYEQLSPNLLKIHFEKGDKLIEIIGTYRI